MRKLIAAGLTGALAMLLLASSASAASHTLPGEYAVFGECPLNRESITDCVYSLTTGGSVKLGSKTVPIKNPVTLQGGFEGEGAGIKFYGAENGDTLSKTAQPVPGGFTGVDADGALEGAVGTVSFNGEFTISKITGTKLVNGTFAAPETSGCGAVRLYEE